LVRARYETAQRQAVPNTLPGAQEEAPVAKADASTVLSSQDPPGGINEPKATIAAIAGWHSQSVSPGFTSYGPMIAEGDCVVEEWETYFHGEDGTLYSNQYCWIKRIQDGKVVQVREYIDSHHAFVILGLHAPWKDLDPPTKPRRRWVPMQPPGSISPATDAIETVFDIAQQFELDPKLLRDIVPTFNPPKNFPATIAGNKALIHALHEAQAKGDVNAVSSFYAAGFRHFIAGEGPLGWNHLPLQQLYAPLVKHLAAPIQVRFGPMVAEGNSVFEEMDILARLDDGTVYNNWHCFIHEILDGKIVQTREYLDTHHLWVVLGRWADWGKTPVPPMRKVRRSNLSYITATYQGKNPFLDLERWHPLGAKA
jgi:ketosteroid isomerase-like protein